MIDLISGFATMLNIYFRFAYRSLTTENPHFTRETQWGFLAYL